MSSTKEIEFIGEKKKLHAARRICELFRGRFSEEVAQQLIDEFGGELQAVDFVLNEKEDVVSQYLKKNTDYIEDLRAESKKITNLLENGIEYEIRQFCCEDCISSWWKKVPTRKPVSKCKKCKVKFDPVPRENEWGWAKFICSCSNEFHAFGEMGVTQSPCYKCNSPVSVNSVLPPRRRIGTRKKSGNDHSCNGVGCYNREPSFVGMKMNSINSSHNSKDNTYNITHNVYNGPIDNVDGGGPPASGAVTGSSQQANNDVSSDKAPVCIHPRSHSKTGKKVRTASRKHISTGSTVNTFLSQGSVDTASVSMCFSLCSIKEHD